MVFFGVTLASLFVAFPATFISSLAGLALLSTIATSLTNAMSDLNSREVCHYNIFSNSKQI
ncbi:benzoate/H(+) symporter BenE family transporter [Arcobacter cryaerophilus gv. pseudocryaerophilus]